MFHAIIYLLAFLGAMILFAVVAIAIAYSILMRRVTRKLQDTVDEMESLLASKLIDVRNLDASEDENCVPPMRINLENDKDRLNLFGKLGPKIHEWFMRHDFEYNGQFVIEELGNERLRIYLDQERNIFASMRLPSDANEAYVEFCFDLGESQLGGIANPPDTTVQLPEDAIGNFYPIKLSDDFELISRMYEEAIELTSNHQTIPVEEHPYAIATLYEVAHAAEMDTRIARGGVTEEEIRESFLQQGVDVSNEDVECIQEQWQSAIENHLLDFSSRGLNHYHSGREILIVHDGSVKSYLVSRFKDVFDEIGKFSGAEQGEAIHNAALELTDLLKRFSPREAIARFRALLPQEARYDLVDELKQPIEADLYVMPKS